LTIIQMSAIIIEFPRAEKKVEVAPSEYQHKIVELIGAWDSKFFNPYLNSIYSESVPYVERWYLETRHCLQNEVKSNILSILLLDKDFCNELIMACNSDIELCAKLVDYPEYEIVAGHWLKKLKRWHSNFLACHNFKPTTHRS